MTARCTITDGLLVVVASTALVSGVAPVAQAAPARSAGHDLVVMPVHGVAFSIDGRTVSWSDTHVTSLAPGASTTVVADGGPIVRATWVATAGAHDLVAHIDDVNRMRSECNEANNMLRGRLTAAAIKPVTAVSARPAMTQQQFAVDHGKDLVVSWQIPTGQPVGTQYVLTKYPADANAGICDRPATTPRGWVAHLAAGLRGIRDADRRRDPVDGHRLSAASHGSSSRLTVAPPGGSMAAFSTQATPLSAR